MGSHTMHSIGNGINSARIEKISSWRIIRDNLLNPHPVGHGNIPTLFRQSQG